jgi:hypothetical protein
MRSTLRSKGVCYNYKGLGSNNFPHSCDSFATPHYHPLLGGKAVTAVPAITPPRWDGVRVRVASLLSLESQLSLSPPCVAREGQPYFD